MKIISIVIAVVAIVSVTVYLTATEPCQASADYFQRLHNEAACK